MLSVGANFIREIRSLRYGGGGESEQYGTNVISHLMEFILVHPSFHVHVTKMNIRNRTIREILGHKSTDYVKQKGVSLASTVSLVVPLSGAKNPHNNKKQCPVMGGGGDLIWHQQWCFPWE